MEKCGHTPSCDGEFTKNLWNSLQIHKKNWYISTALSFKIALSCQGMLDLRAIEISGSRWTGRRNYRWELALEEKDYFDGEVEEDDFGVAVGGDVGAR